MVYYYAFDLINNCHNINIDIKNKSEIGSIGEIDVNNLAKIEQCNIKVIDCYLSLDHLHISIIITLIFSQSITKLIL